MSMNTVVHLTVRLEAPGTHRRQVDLVLPAHSSVAECLGEVLPMLKAPVISVPWQPSTPAGTPLSATAPLATLPLTHGDILVLRPHVEPPVPTVIDAAEALVNVPMPHPASHLSAAAMAAGLAGLLWWAATLQYLSWLAFAAGALVCVIMLAVSVRASTGSPYARVVLASGTPIPAGLAAWNYITEHDTSPAAVITGGLTALAAMACACVAVQVVSLCSARINACWGALLLVGACAVGAYGVAPADARVAGAAAACVGVALVGLLAVPTLSVHLAGCSVPRLPSAGQDFAVADHIPPAEQAQASAHRAVLLHDGAVLGLSIAGSAGIAGACVSCDADMAPYVAALCVAASAAVGFHAIRHRSPWATWSLWAWALMSLVCSVATVPIVGLLLVSGCASSVLWAHLAPSLNPSAISWLERIEALAIAVAFPLAAHIAGVFVAIRGLG